MYGLTDTIRENNDQPHGWGLVGQKNPAHSFTDTSYKAWPDNRKCDLSRKWPGGLFVSNVTRVRTGYTTPTGMIQTSITFKNASWSYLEGCISCLQEKRNEKV